MIRRLAKSFVVLAGSSLLVFALALAITVPAHIEPASARPVFLAVDVALCGAGAWLLARAFSRRIAWMIALAMLGLLAFGMLATAFGGPWNSTDSPTLQLAAIAFAVLLTARIGLALRRPRRSAGGIPPSNGCDGLPL